MFRVFSTAWRRAAGLLAGGFVASVCQEQLSRKLQVQADRLSIKHNRQAGLPMTMSNNRSYGQTGFWLLLSILLLLPVIGHAVPAGTSIDNTATATFNGGTTNTSNIVSTTTASTPSTLEFLQYAPTSGTAQLVPVATTEYEDGGGSFNPLPPPTTASGSLIDISSPVLLEPVTTYPQGEAVFAVGIGK